MQSVAYFVKKNVAPRDMANGSAWNIFSFYFAVFDLFEFFLFFGHGSKGGSCHDLVFLAAGALPTPKNCIFSHGW